MDDKSPEIQADGPEEEARLFAERVDRIFSESHLILEDLGKEIGGFAKDPPSRLVTDVAVHGTGRAANGRRPGRSLRCPVQYVGQLCARDGDFRHGSNAGDRHRGLDGRMERRNQADASSGDFRREAAGKG